MAAKKTIRTTTVGKIDDDILAYTAGQDVELDLHLVEADCLGTAAHAVMLSRMKIKPRIFTPAEVKKIKAELAAIVRQARAGKFTITLADQDVHLAVERVLTRKLGEPGKKVHTARSRNDQVAVDLRLYARDQLAHTIGEAAALAEQLVAFGRKHVHLPMVGRTHMQPAMPSSVGLWATAWAEELLDDITLLINAGELNDRCPLGSAASFGVPLPIDRQLTSDLLGFSGLCHNVLYAANARGKLESIILHAMSQTMLTLSRVAQDLMLYTLPEFGYFTLPVQFCTGSSIMPNKSNPDVLELLRGKTAVVLAYAQLVNELIKASPGGYNRDIQEAKAPFLDGIQITRQSLRILAACIKGLKVNPKALEAGFEPGVFATDRALELVGQGMSFRDAYHHVKAHLDELESVGAFEAIALKTHLGAPAGLDFDLYKRRIKAALQVAREEKAAHRKVSKALLGV